MIPGEYLFDGADLELNAGRPVVTLKVNNTGDRPVQVGSHYHFFEVNRGAGLRPREGLRHAARPAERHGRSGSSPATSRRSS